MTRQSSQRCAILTPQPTPNPVKCKEGKGLRHFGCLHYDECLDKAAKGMWSGFTCEKCAYFQ